MQPGTFVKSHYYKHQIGIYQHERGHPRNALDYQYERSIPEILSNYVTGTLSRLNNGLSVVVREAVNECIINLEWLLFLLSGGRYKLI